VFDRFWEGDVVGGRVSVGSSLYLARLVAEAHGGRVALEASTLSDLVFTATVPM
jgi:hypothetical protein